MNFGGFHIDIDVITIPLIAALIGWGTNYIAVKMIFRPLRPRRFFFFTLHGLIPRRQRELAEKIGATIEANFVSHKDVEKVLNSGDMQSEVAKMIDEQVDKFLNQQLGTIPMIGMFLQGPLIDEIKGRLVKQLQGSVPELLDRLMTKLEQDLSFRDIVREKVEAFDLRKLEDIIYDISARELRAIEYLGGVLGFLVGLIQVAIVSWAHR